MSGFVGAVYMDCQNKPCYLCGVMGHSTRTCPYRVAPGHGCVPAAGASGDGLLSTLRKREAGGRCRPAHRVPPGRWQIQSAVLKLHARRVTCLEFHPTLDHLVLSGDKHGQVAVWDWAKCFERTVYKQVGGGEKGGHIGGHPSIPGAALGGPLHFPRSPPCHLFLLEGAQPSPSSPPLPAPRLPRLPPNRATSTAGRPTRCASCPARAPIRARPPATTAP